MHTHSPRETSTRRRGSVLLLVLVVVALLTLGVYVFTEAMVTEVEATSMYVREAEARCYAESGIEFATALLGARAWEAGVNLHNNPEMFRSVIVRDSEVDRARGRFTLICPDEADLNGQLVRYGLTDESAKLNINALVQSGRTDEQMLDALLALPGMTIDLADAILDWLDDDDEPRPYGAEAEYYLSLDPPYLPRNGPVSSIEELLDVRGVTPELLFGTVDDRLASAGMADINIQPGWGAYLTVNSRESNRRADGSPRINLNETNLAELHTQLTEAFDADTATFVCAYRIFGPDGAGAAAQGRGRGGQGDGGRGGRGGGMRGGGGGRGGGGFPGGGGPPGGGRPPGGGSGPPAAPIPPAAPAAPPGGGAMFSVGSGISSRPAAGGGSNLLTNVLGVDLATVTAEFPINSVYDLVGLQIEVTVNDSTTLLTSPWPADPGQIASYLPALLETLTTVTDEFRVGRININLAPPEVLAGIPGMNETIVDAILNARIGAADDPSRLNTGWLLTEGILTLQQLREMDPYITGRGDVYRLESVGHFEGGGPTVSLEAIIDASQIPPRVVFHRDLSHLGLRWSRAQF